MMRRRRLPVVALLLSLLQVSLGAHSASANKDKARDYYRRGMAKYVLDKWDAAIHEFELGFQEEPEPAFLYNIAQAHRQAKRPGEAIAYYRKYLDLAPDAKDRGEVEKTIAECEKEQKPEARDSDFALMPDEKPMPHRVPAAAITGGPPAPVEKPHARRWPIWVGIAAGVAVAGAATAIAIVATRPTPEPDLSIWNLR